MGVAAVVVLGGAVFGYRSMTARPAEVSLPQAVAPAPASGGSGGAGGTGGSGAAAPDAVLAPVPSTTGLASSVVVQVAGAVLAPGVVTLAPGARWNDAITAAGGPGPDADLDRVNLAAPATDGARLFIPRRGQDPPAEVAATSARPAGGTPTPNAADAAPIDLNTATADELDGLPGVGPSTAAAILEYRDRSGPFRAVDDLDQVAGIGPTRLERLRPLVRVG